MTMIPVITLDGPSGVGKGTISQRLALALGWHYLDSGALYRALAWRALDQAVSLTDEVALVKLMRVTPIEFIPGGVVRVAGQVVTQAIRTQRCAEAASQLAQLAGVRAALVPLQQQFCQEPGLVADGRDMGSVIFKHAALKLFLTASLAARAERRYHQLKALGNDVSLADIFNEVSLRDARDQSRLTAPLQAAADAVWIDTTLLNVEQVFAIVSQAVADAGFILKNAGAAG